MVSSARQPKVSPEQAEDYLKVTCWFLGVILLGPAAYLLFGFIVWYALW